MLINRILICYESDCGGETIATENIIKELKIIKNINISSYTHQQLGNTSTLGYSWYIIQSIIFWIRKILKTQKLNWVYTTTYTAGIAAVLLKPIYKFKICFHYHGNRIPPKSVRNLSFISRYTQLYKYLIVNFLHLIVLKFSELIIAPSSLTKDYLIRYFPVSINNKIVIIPNGVDLNKFTRLSKQARLELLKKYKLSTKYPIISYVGRVNKEKRIEVLIKSLLILKRKFFKICLLIVYLPTTNKIDGKYKNDLEISIRKNKLFNYVRWLSDTSNLSEIYNLSNIIVLPSNQENFPLTLLEALACGTLFIGQKIGAMKDILEKIDSDLLISDLTPYNIADIIISFLNKPDKKLEILQKKCKQIAQKYPWGNTVKLLLKYLITDK